ncbi:MAG TPA: tetratricopeptide repeat protein, partial [Clostridia bacterium]|nr:tetratricopeptide repeat protein [Clostridia bacterium]
DHLPSHLSLAQIYMMRRMPERALQVLSEIRAKSQLLQLNRTNEMQLLWVETAAHLARSDLAGAENSIKAALQRFPADEDVLSVATKVYMDFGHYSNALTTIDQQLKIRPNNEGALFYKGNACLQLNEFGPAIDALTRLLNLETNTTSTVRQLSLFMRARAYMGSDRLDLAQKDYEILAQALPNEFPVYYDLGEIAYRKKDTRAAIRNYELYLKNAPTNFVDDIKLVNTRLQELKAGAP